MHPASIAAQHQDSDSEGLEPTQLVANISGEEADQSGRAREEKPTERLSDCKPRDNTLVSRCDAELKELWTTKWALVHAGCGAG